MNREREIAKKTEVGQAGYKWGEYLAELTRFTADPSRIALVEEAADQCVEKFIADPAYSFDACLISNEIGSDLLSRQLTVEAILAFQFSFDEEGAYNLNRPTYARNFLDALNRHFQGLGSQITPDAEDFFLTIGSTILESRNCAREAKNRAVFRNAYNNVQSGQADPKSWPDPALLSKAQDYDAAEKIGNNIIGHLKSLV